MAPDMITRGILRIDEDKRSFLVTPSSGKLVQVQGMGVKKCYFYSTLFPSAWHKKLLEWLFLLKKVTRSQDLTQHLLGLVSTLAVTRPPFFGDFPIQLDELFVYPYTSNNLRTSFWNLQQVLPWQKFPHEQEWSSQNVLHWCKWRSWQSRFSINSRFSLDPL